MVAALDWPMMTLILSKKTLDKYKRTEVGRAAIKLLIDDGYTFEIWPELYKKRKK